MTDHEPDKAPDANDILREHGPDALRNVMDGGQVFPGGNGQDIPTFDPRFRLRPFNAIKLSTASTYLVKGIFPRGGLVVVWGTAEMRQVFLGV